MKKSWIRVIATSILLMAGVSRAAVTPITVTFVGGTTSFPIVQTGSANFVVAVNPGVAPSNIPLNLHFVSSGASGNLTATQITSGASPCAGVSTLCGSSFALAAGQSCCLAFTLASSIGGDYMLQPTVSTTPSVYNARAGPAVRVPVAAHAPPVTLTASVTTLALSVNDPGLDPALTGNPRQITITNTSAVETAFDMVLTVSNPTPAHPIITTTCGDIPPHGTCTITITPNGPTASAVPYNLTPTPITLTLTGNNTNTLSPTVNILGYGSVYQGGYLFFVDDSYTDYPISTSIGGKIVALNDQMPASPGVIWSSNGTGGMNADYVFDIIYGIAQDSTPSLPDPSTNQVAGQNACLGKTDGACNSNNIFVYYENFSTPHPINHSYYAEGLCKQTISGYSDWYLPAYCEWGPSSFFLTCPEQNTITDLMPLIGSTIPCTTPTGCLAGTYWSSTEEVSGGPSETALVWVIFQGGTLGEGNSKNGQNSVRCARHLTP